MNRIRFNKYTFLGFQILISDWLIHWDESGQSDVETSLDWQVFLFRNQQIYHFSFYHTRPDFFSLTTNALWLVRNQSSFSLVKISLKHKQSFEFCLLRRKIFRLVSHLDFFSNGHQKIRVCLFLIRDLLTRTCESGFLGPEEGQMLINRLVDPCPEYCSEIIIIIGDFRVGTF